jgi:hypothetical protein
MRGSGIVHVFAHKGEGGWGFTNMIVYQILVLSSSGCCLAVVVVISPGLGSYVYHRPSPVHGASLEI